MKGEKKSIRELVRILATPNDFFETVGVPCKVTEVDEAELVCTCEPINGDAAFMDVRLQAGEGNGIVIIPRIGSVVIVQPINETTGFVALFSQVESIQLLDGSFGGLVKVQDLVDKINALENKTNDILNQLKSIVIPLAPSGTYPFAPEFASINPITPTTTVEDLENPDITHGAI